MKLQKTTDTCFLVGPAGSGKAKAAKRLKAWGPYGTIVDGWVAGDGIVPFAIHVTSEPLPRIKREFGAMLDVFPVKAVQHALGED
ncbi:hypothetical protein [Hyphomonas sp.]|jgi:hypothetical protein|uniref:hypothetical protein n=1 Tax=Hyphomonas sp. TaxID=87 RepID=UPI0032EEFA63